MVISAQCLQEDMPLRMSDYVSFLNNLSLELSKEHKANASELSEP
jgi:hypothetical protein